MHDEIPDEVSTSIRTARIHALTVSVSQRLILADVFERLETYSSLLVTENTEVWYKINFKGMKVQLELHNPGGNLEIIRLPFDDESFAFPNRAWNRESVKLQIGNEDLIVEKIISSFGLIAPENYN